MSALNPRLQKFKTIIKDINTPRNVKPIEPTAAKEKIIPTNLPESSGPLNLRISPSYSKQLQLNDQEKVQTFRNRKPSCSSCSSHSSQKDFSPASDDDQEYIVSSSEDDSSSETVAKPRTGTKKVEVGNNFQMPKTPNLSSSSSSSSSSSTSAGSSSSSDSSTSSDSDSEVSSADHSTSAKRKLTPKGRTELQRTSESDTETSRACRATPAKRRLLSNNQTELRFCSPPPVATLKNLALIYPSSSSEDTDPPTTSENTQDDFQFDISYPTENSIANESYSNEVFEIPNLSLRFKNPPSLKFLATEVLNKNITTPEANRGIGTQSDDSTRGNTTTTSRRRRKRGSKKARAKALRNKGLQYTSATANKVTVPGRKIGKPCGDRCRLKCRDNISEQDRLTIFERYWDLGDLSKQRNFIASHITEVKPKYQYKRVDSNRKNKHAFYLSVNGIKTKICKIFFKSTLGINDRPIRTVIDKLNAAGIVEPDLRGKHNNHGTKVLPEILAEVKKHIESIPRIESHYLRKQTTREYIEGGKTVTDLYNDYKHDCIEKGIDYVKINIYRKVFNEDFNMSFFKPKKDQCEDCVGYTNASSDQKEELEEKYKTHIEEKELSREEKNKDKALVNENYIVACYDLQAQLPIPRGEVSTFYYKSKLNCLNFTINELKTNVTECYFWTEVEGQKGANEIGTCVYKFIEKKANLTSDNIDFIFYSDNCCGQQKNQFVFSMYIYALKSFANINSISHKFLIKGHTQNENDSVHSTIEKQIKKMLKSGPIYVPDQYIYAIREAKKKGEKYNVNVMSHAEFFDIKNVQEYKLNKNTENETVKVGEIKIFKAEKIENGLVKVTYKTSYANENYKEFKLVKNARARPHLKRLNSSRLPLTERKKEDLRYLIRKNAIPHYYVSSYYNSLLES